MDLKRLGLGERIAAGAAIVLFAVMFIDWFGIEVTGGGPVEGGGTGVTGSVNVDVQDAGVSAWDALDVIPLMLMLAIFAVLLTAFIAANRTQVDTPVPLGMVATALSALAVVLILYRVISPPEFGSIFGVTVEGTRKLGLYLGLIAAAAMTYGGWRTMAAEGTSTGGAPDHPPPSGSEPPPGTG